MSYKPGQWKATCDRCGYEFLAKDLHKDWQGLRVCKHDLETRHPQDFIKVRPERITPPWTRPEPADVFTGPTCTPTSIQGRADIGTANCARADLVLPL